LVPLDSVANEQLSPWHIVVREVWIIKNASLDDHGTWERLARPEERGATVRTKVRRDLLAGICSLRNLFGLARLELETVFGDDKVIAESCTADLPAVEAMA